MRIAVVGAGRMGRAVEAAARARAHEIVTIVAGRENREGEALTAERLSGAEVVVEFTHPAQAPRNLERLAGIGIPVVTGTTGWREELPRIEALFREKGGALLHAANFSLGVQILLRAAREIARSLRGREGFDAVLVEWHHRAKVDAPSGTALRIQGVLREEDPGRSWPVTSVRSGWIPGTHAVEVDGRHESLSLVHTARDRAVFAEGAVTAAEWLQGRTGVYTLEDVLSTPSEGGDA